MRDGFSWSSHCSTAIWAVLAGLLFSCSSGQSLRPSDIRGSEDAIILGRIRFLPGSTCLGDFKLPIFELRNTTDGKSTPFATPGSLWLKEGQCVEIPISRKMNPGSYEFRIKSVEAPAQSAWLKPGFITLAEFTMAKGQLKYFGTIEVEIRCEQWNKQSATFYVAHAIRDEHEQEMILFKDEFPQVYEMYKDRVVLEMP